MLGIAPTTYWSAKTRPPCARAKRDAELGRRLEALWEKNYSVYGRRKLTRAAQKAGIGRPGPGRRLMRANGRRVARRERKRFHRAPPGVHLALWRTHADPAAVRAPDLVQHVFTATRPNEKWVADFTYCSTWSGIVYMAFITDVLSRRIVGGQAARSMTAPLVVDALDMAAWSRRGVDIEGVICHSDAGARRCARSSRYGLSVLRACPLTER